MQLTLVALFALSPVLALATPVASPIGTKIPLGKRNSFLDNGVVDANALRAHLSRTQAKITRGFDNFKKNTGAVHPNDNRNLFKRAQGLDPLTDFEEDLWFGAISVGTPAHSFTVDFDSGSSDLFLPSPLCVENCEGFKRYNTNASRTAVALNEGFEIEFGDGSAVVGNLFTDTVSIVGLTATKQTLAAATQYSAGFAKDVSPPDGLMGMGFQEISASGSVPVFQTLVAQRQTTQPVFAFKLADNGSELAVGGVDRSLFKGSFTRVPVTTVGFWQVNLDSVQVGGRTVAPTVTSIIDTGTTLIIGDSVNVRRFYAAIPGSKNASATLGDGIFTIPCNARVDASLTFGGKRFAIPDDIFNFGQVSEGSSDCVGGLAAEDGIGFWVVGDIFLRSVYTLFDVGTTQVGFADLS